MRYAIIAIHFEGRSLNWIISGESRIEYLRFLRPEARTSYKEIYGPGL